MAPHANRSFGSIATTIMRRFSYFPFVEFSLQAIKRVVLMGSLVMLQASIARSEESNSELDFLTDIKPILEYYCFDCHGYDDTEGGVDLLALQEAGKIYSERKTWEKALKQTKAEAMPPDGEEAPTPEERELIISWIHEKLSYIDPNKPVDPGHVTVRRLNRIEYDNTINDLFEIHSTFSSAFPDDGVGYGFDNIGDVLTISPIAMERYLEAAERVTDILFNAGQRFELDRNTFAGFFDIQRAKKGKGNNTTLYPGDEASMDIEFPVAGEYEVAFKAWAMVPESAEPKKDKYDDQYGEKKVELSPIPDFKKIVPARILVDDQELGIHLLEPGSRENSKWTRVRVQAKAGNRIIRLQLVEPENLTEEELAKWRADPPRLGMRSCDISGPHKVDLGDLGSLHALLLTSRPDDEISVDEAAREILEPLGERAYRRPLKNRELKSLLRFVKLGMQRGSDFESAIERAVHAILLSPHFLYRLELGPTPTNPEMIHPVGDFAIASRLSYFLWRSAPDGELLRLASENGLSDSRILASQVQRMMEDPKAERFIADFFRQWLDLRKLNDLSIDRKVFTNFSSKLKSDLEKETLLFTRSIAQENRSVLELLSADYTFANNDLAEFYGLPEIDSPFFERVSIADLPRRGILTQASILMLTSYPNRTSPTKRGNWILEAILGDEPPPPPANVAPLEDVKEGSLDISLREALKIHREHPSCSSCHKTMDTIGLGLENFDAIGQWREMDGPHVIDASGDLPGGQTFSSPSELLEILQSRHEDFARVITQKLMTFALGRGLEYYDRVAVDKIMEETKGSDYRFKDIVNEIALSRPFRLQRGE